MLVSNIKGPVISGSNQGSNNLTLKGWPLTVSKSAFSFKSAFLFRSPCLLCTPERIYHRFHFMSTKFLFGVKYLLPIKFIYFFYPCCFVVIVQVISIVLVDWCCCSSSCLL